MIELVAAGVEGGSKAAIEASWDLNDAGDLYDHWAQAGPPAHIGVAALAACWGARLTRDAGPAQPRTDLVSLSAAEVAEIAQTTVAQTGDPLEASRRIIARLVSNGVQ